MNREIKKEKKHYAWALKHMDELPFEPTVLNAGEWVKIEGCQKAPKTGIYLFICAGDNHLLYEMHELRRGMDIKYCYQDNRSHIDGCALVKPLYYYYIPYNNPRPCISHI